MQVNQFLLAIRKLVPPDIQSLVLVEGWECLRSLVYAELNKAQYSCGDRWMCEDEESLRVCITIASLHYWLRSLEHKDQCRLLTQWCWEHHYAQLVNDAIASLLPEPERTNYFRENCSLENPSDDVIFKQFVSPWLGVWLHYGVNSYYPSTQIVPFDSAA